MTTDVSVQYDELMNRRRIARRKYIADLLDELWERRKDGQMNIAKEIEEEVKSLVLELEEDVVGTYLRTRTMQRFDGSYYVVIERRHRWVSD